MRALLAIVVFFSVIFFVAAVATVITKQVGGDESMSFLIGMLGGPLAGISAFVVWSAGR